MDRSKLICLVVLLAVVPLLTLQQASAQAVYGSILGTVTDAQGAVVPGASITVTSIGKGSVVTTTSNESGNYSVTHLLPDVYKVKVEATGFKSVEQAELQVSADTGSRWDAQLAVGGASEVVEVTAEAPQLKTDRADVSVELSSRQVGELPVFNRNFQSLELLTPGTQLLTGWSHATTENPQGSKQIFVNGQHFAGTGYELDGTDNQDPILGIIIVNPSLDTVTETKVATQNYDAEFGKAIAGLVTAQTKSGSNEFHGSGYFYDLNPKGEARDPFSSTAPGLNTWKQYGAAIGGPVIKDKVFFFGGYEGTRRQSGVTYTIGVPTNLVRSTCLQPNPAPTDICDLSEYLPLNGNSQVYTPYLGIGSRTAYANNQIPFSDLQAADPTGVAEKILALLPAPNAPGSNNGVQNNYSASGSGAFNDYQYTGRGDYVASQKLQVFGRYTHAHFKVQGTPVFGSLVGGPGLGANGLAGGSTINNYSLATGFNYTLSPTLLTDFRFGYFRYNPQAFKANQSLTAASSLGLVGLNTSDPATAGLPSLIFDSNQNIQTIGDSTLGNGASGLGAGLNVSRCNCPLTEKEQGEQYTNNWTKIKGNHQIKFGADLRHATNLRIPSDANRTGVLNFDHLGTSNGSTGGLDLATFLFADVTGFNRYVGSPTEFTAIETQNRYFIYGQDTWRVTQKLTLNYGLRWEHYTPESVAGKGGGGFALLPEGVIRVAGYGGIRQNGNVDATNKNFAPRLGIAYEPDSKTVVRMGFGRSFDVGVFGTLFGHTVTQNLPVLANQQIDSPTNDKTTPAFNFTGTCLPAPYDPTVCGPVANQFPVIPANGILPLFGPNGNVSPHIRPDKVIVPTVDAWNVSVQRQITSKATLELAYVGNHGTHVFKGNGPSYNVNQATVVGYEPALIGGGLSYNARSPFNTAFTTDYTDSSGVTMPIQCCSGQSLGVFANDGTNHYEAFQVKLTQRAANGLTLLAHYTYSKAYDNDGGYQPDPSQGYGRVDYNRDSVFVFTSLYDLPFGKGKHFGGNMSRAMDMIAGGWQWNSVITLGSGLPFSPSWGQCGWDHDTGPCRPNLNGSFHLGAGSFNPVSKSVQYFTPVAALCPDPLAGCGAAVLTSGPFSDPGVARFGNVQRNAFTGPGEFLADMSVFKNFKITERVNAQFRAEFFNVFNHPVLSNPSNCIDCAGNGTINSILFGTRMRQFQLGFRGTF